MLSCRGGSEIEGFQPEILIRLGMIWSPPHLFVISSSRSQNSRSKDALNLCLGHLWRLKPHMSVL